MPRQGTAYVLPSANPHTQVTSTGTADVKAITLEPNCAAILVSARTNSGFLTFNGSTPSATNGLDLIAGASAVLLPIGFYAHSGHQLKWVSAAAGNAVLDLLQMT
jgi:hypothetical protein